MKQLRHTPLYVSAYPMGQGACRAEELFHGLWRAVVCLSVLVVLLACAGVIYAEGDGDPVEWIDIQDVLEAQSSDSDPDSGIDPGSGIDPDSGIDPVDPSDPDYGGTADQDPAADPWVDPGYVPDADYGVQPYSSAAYYWTQSEITAVVNAANNLILYNGQASIQTANSHLFDIYSRLGNIYNLLNSTNAGSFNARLKSIDDSLDVNGYIPQRLLDIYARQAVTNSKLDTVNTKLDTANTKLDTVNTNLDTVNTNLISIRTKLDTVNTNLSTVIQYIGNTNSWLSRIFGYIPLIYNRLLGDYYHVLDDNPFNITSGLYQLAYVDDSTKLIPLSPASNGYFASQSVSSFRAFEMVRYPDRTSSVNAVSSISPVLLSGSYYVMAFSFPSTTVLTSQSVVAFTVGSVPITLSDILSFSYSNYLGNSTFTIVFKPSASVALDRFRIVLSNSSNMISGGYVRFVFAEAPSQLVQDLQASGAVNSGQAGATQQLQQGIDQTEVFEQKMFQDVSKYTSQLNFGLGDWAEAASGISYIGSVFMLIWDNSPVQPIILSLMLGLCMLLLGRGAKVADAASRSSSEERASIHQGKGRGS